MSFASITLALSTSMAMLACSAPNELSHTEKDNVDSIYLSSTRNFVFANVGGLIYMGAIPDNADLRQISRLIASSGPLSDLSTSTVSCVAITHITIALPHVPHPGERYACNGLSFQVEHCNGADCSTYQIIATCGRFLDGRCTPSSHAGVPALVYRLTGSRSGGISSIDFDLSSSEGELILRQGPGFLSSQ